MRLVYFLKYYLFILYIIQKKKICGGSQRYSNFNRRGKMDEKAEAEIKQVWESKKESELRTIYKVYSRGVQV